tara:strand:- start:49 stop:399 length:351 start_codon:yes stop_codon:yes gene_type:complete
MSTFLSKDVLAGIEAAQKTSLKKKNRLRVEFNKNNFPVMGLTKNGFCVAAEMAPMIRGLVNLYDGDKHLKQCLIVASKEENGIIHFDFKRTTATQTSAPKDFHQERKVAALIPRLL